ncbi:hypothetical protein HK102_006657, partial [Quaeritorhiza haematococci]
KTIQIIAFLNYVYHEHSLYPALIVVPNSTLNNWVREFAKWAPNIVVVQYAGTAEARKVIREYEMFGGPSSRRDSMGKESVGGEDDAEDQERAGSMRSGSSRTERVLKKRNSHSRRRNNSQDGLTESDEEEYGTSSTESDSDSNDTDNDPSHHHHHHHHHGRHRPLRCHVVITSYEMITLESHVFKKVDWEFLVIDEAHRLKNDQSKFFEGVREVVGEGEKGGRGVKGERVHKICLTGTPLQNNIRELFNLMSFIDPDKFGDVRGLEEKYGVLDQRLVEELHQILRPYFLRRTKDEVLKGDLPPKVEVLVPVTMTALQRELYKATLCRNYELLRSLASDADKILTSTGKVDGRRKKKPPNQNQQNGEGAGNGGDAGTTNVRKMSLLNILMELRKILNHPYLLEGVEPMDLKTPEEVQERLISASGKLALLHRMLKKLRAGGHRVLIFSQFKILLDVLDDYFHAEGIRFARLDGNLNAEEKQNQIDLFSDPDSDMFCFLLSTRAGGQGINLAAADTIIIYDVDFNPHMDIQAMSRCHRIGQVG